MKIKVLIVDDHQLFRDGIVNLIAESDDITVAGNAANGKEAVEMVDNLKPDVVLMDIAMPVMNGVNATRIIKDKHPGVQVVALSMHSDRQYVKQMLAEGALGYLFKNCSYNQLIEAIKTVHSGKKYLSSEITEMIINDYIGNTPKEEEDDYELSKREKEILVLLAEGKSTREIADMLFISVKTVGTHKKNILEKLNVETTADLIKFAIKKGMVEI